MDVHQSLGVSYSLQDTSSMEEPGSSDTSLYFSKLYFWIYCLLILLYY